MGLKVKSIKVIDEPEKKGKISSNIFPEIISEMVDAQGYMKIMTRFLLHRTIYPSI